LEINSNPLVVEFKSISDFSQAINSLVNFLFRTFNNRLRSIVKFLGAKRIGDIINKAIEFIPDEIDIPNTNLYIQGGLSTGLAIKQDSYIQIPLDWSL
jgi:hypothetical protein